MAVFLSQLGRLAFRRRWYVVLIWAAVLGAVGLGAVKAPAAVDDGLSMPGIESQQAFDLLEERFPSETADTAVATIVFLAPDGEKITAAEHERSVLDTVAALRGGDRVATVDDALQPRSVSKDGSVAFTTVTYDVTAADLTDADRAQVKRAIAQAEASGLTVETGGSALSTGGGPGGTAEVIGVSIAAVVLLITFGSLAAAGLPLLTALVGVGIGMASIIALSSTLGLSDTTGTLAMMLGLAVGIDYALFVVSRYREEREKGRTPDEATALAVGTAGSAVVFAGLTVVIALAGLGVVGVPMLTEMGMAAAGAVVLAVVVALTLVPALLGFWPNAVMARRDRRTRRDGQDGQGWPSRQRVPSGGTRWARFVQRRPIPVLLLGVAGLGALALPVGGLQLGMPGDEALPLTATERRAYDALAEGFGPGFNGPLTIVVDAKDTPDPETAIEEIAREIGDTRGVVSVSPAHRNEAGNTAVFSAVPLTAPTDEKTKDLVNTIRDERSRIESATGATYRVTGTTALNIDMAQKVQSALAPYLIVVVGLAIVLLTVVFRSLLVPLKAALGFLLSVLASLGAVVMVFQHGYGADLLGVEQTGPIMSLMPIFLVGIVFGLAMDYEVFLVSRIREAYVHGERAAQAVTTGFRHSARVVVAAALIMIAVFAGFIGESDSMIKMIGFGLASAILFDAFVVRMALVPAVLALLGDKAWWLPKWLDRVLPRVDVEGESLTRHSRTGESATVPSPAAESPSRAGTEPAPDDGPSAVGRTRTAR
ncbi:MMPL family transporter [Streptomyces subrutilus]|uniref:MMPL family transporter n=1 Tax=Streptomyces subrutilus TaxID=36818 RepID=UPI00342B4FB4